MSVGQMSFDYQVDEEATLNPPPSINGDKTQEVYIVNKPRNDWARAVEGHTVLELDATTDDPPPNFP